MRSTWQSGGSPGAGRRGALRWASLIAVLSCALALPALRPAESAQPTESAPPAESAQPTESTPPAQSTHDDLFPRPAELETAIHFWVRVYTEIDTNSGFLHDENNLAVVYETLHFAPDTSRRQRERAVEAARDRYVAALERIATSSGPLSADDERIRKLWGEATPKQLIDATEHIRFQLGQSDRFREGLERSGRWEQHIAETLARLGLPPELAALPYVESSFNPSARSKVGAAGLWQFMRSTGRRYMRIDSTVDDRLDPFLSTEAAAQLLSYNHRLLGTWPLAITAYNHGAAGVRRAVEELGTDDIATIVSHYKSPTFGFASRNFYVSFLAALEIDRDPEKYFGRLPRESEAQFQEVKLPFRTSIPALESALHVDGDTLRALNPALRPVCWRGRRPVPKGYPLRLPVGGTDWTPKLLAARLGPSGAAPAASPTASPAASPTESSGAAEAVLASAGAPSRHRVRRGETLASLADHYGVSAEALAQLNGLRPRARLRVGRYIRVPAEPAALNVVARSTSPGSGVPTAKAMPAQVAQIPPATQASPLSLIPQSPQSATPAVDLLSQAVPGQASAGTAGQAPAGTAGLDSDQDEEELSLVAPSAASSQPVSAAEEEALGPSLGPAAVEGTATVDPIDYSVAKNDTIVVAAAETLGHYADWLGISASALRKVNHMRYGRPVVVGHRIKLIFPSVTPEQFEAKRRDYHRALEAAYFAAHHITGTEIYVAQRGDSLWNVTQRYAHVPIWLLQQYNPDVDFSDMRPGTQIAVPRVVEEDTD